ncbi:DUF1810 domain-containing protein [Microbulbifer yueqingensis]|uniref:Uncharacterized protein, DUF1810 family n=1 Tax=Microbulbifer yueqingensis TaxID=658219 RepID=A0A1G9DE46_9GAMM|nr:DUF1810 domain-containing protein [Microbulbifer yueqingensis]SDK62156.1 Uncharacterized protein, DUF1810 family [Microbulbifer yueqingensis]
MNQPPQQNGFSLERFVTAQQSTYQSALAELAAGRKRSHWMWFIFPQLAGLGRSATARHYAIASLAEARAYLAHPVLGPRLAECCERLLQLEGLSAHDIFGSPDDLKLKSSMTLFELAAGGDSLFGKVLEKYYRGDRDQRTMELVGT